MDNNLDEMDKFLETEPAKGKLKASIPWTLMQKSWTVLANHLRAHGKDYTPWPNAFVLVIRRWFSKLKSIYIHHTKRITDYWVGGGYTRPSKCRKSVCKNWTFFHGTTHKPRLSDLCFWLTSRRLEASKIPSLCSVSLLEWLTESGERPVWFLDYWLTTKDVRIRINSPMEMHRARSRTKELCSWGARAPHRHLEVSGSPVGKGPGRSCVLREAALSHSGF